MALQLPIIMYLNVRLQEHITKHEIIKKKSGTKNVAAANSFLLLRCAAEQEVDGQGCGGHSVSGGGGLFRGGA